ncbi:MAG: hypothetical protein ACKV2O_02725 [Acidimicrobiales bacterium]
MTELQHTLQCRAPGGLVRAVARAATAENRTRSSIIQEAVQQWLQRRELRVLAEQPYGPEEFPPPDYTDLADLDDTDWAALYPDQSGSDLSPNLPPNLPPEPANPEVRKGRRARG